MIRGDQNFLDRILDKRVGYGATVILSAIIGFLFYFFMGNLNTVATESDSNSQQAKFILIAVGLPILMVVRKIYWSLRMNKFLLKNLKNAYISYDKDALLRYYRTHAWRNVDYYYWSIKNELENTSIDHRF